MARKVTFEDDRGVEYPVFAIRYGPDGWEDDWSCIEEHDELSSVIDVFSSVSFDAYEKALSGWVDPLVEELGLEPLDCFIKVQEDLKKCRHRGGCIDHRPDECGPHLSFPVCFMADVDAQFRTRSKLTRLFEYWASGRWVCLVPYRRSQDFEE